LRRKGEISPIRIVYRFTDSPFDESRMKAQLTGRERAWECINTMKTVGPQSRAVLKVDSWFLPAIVESAMHVERHSFGAHSASELVTQNAFATQSVSSRSIERAASIVVEGVS